MSRKPPAGKTHGDSAPSTAIVIHISPKAKADFESYAGALWLDAASLLKLLVLREKRLRRLAILKQANKAPLRQRQPKGHAEKRRTVAARLPSAEDVTGFDKYAEECGLNRDSAGAWLIERELDEHWLDCAVFAPAARRLRPENIRGKARR
jgi:hypothetical protein